MGTWNENVMNGTKYVWLAASSSFKGKADRNKYEKARRLCKNIGKVRTPRSVLSSLRSNEFELGLKCCDNVSPYLTSH